MSNFWVALSDHSPLVGATEIVDYQWNGCVGVVVDGLAAISMCSVHASVRAEVKNI